ncbi:unnamed protein product [Brachionus calyciflorus]|uniref:Uncharacterized protein n=1 Tax=Brachionus calyciflorus TaxID=104777 RepID=A0A813M4Z2_9BILA|nr:unnamed protein product [Brachionus calyciflorus]
MNREENQINYSSKDEFILYVWPGEWDLPTLDPECLTIMSYLKFAQVQHKVQIVDKAWDLFKNPLPRMTYKQKVYIGIDQIVDCIKKKKNVDLLLNEKNYPDMIALLCLFKQKFIPAFNSLCWLDEDNTYTVTRRAYGKNLRFPLSILKVKMIAEDIRNSIMCQYRSSHVQPTLLDAYIFGYLSILIKAPFVNSPLKNHAVACSNLCSIITRIQKENFPQDKKKKDTQQLKFLNWFKFLSLKNWIKSSDSSTNGTAPKFSDIEEWEKRRQQIIACTLALSAMIIYAFAIGFIRVNFITTDVEIIEKN